MSDPSPTDPTTQTGFTAYLEELRARAALIVAARPVNKAALFDALAGAGITAVRVDFDGGCDEGQIEAIAARAGETPVELPPDLVPIREPRRDGTGLEVRP